MDTPTLRGELVTLRPVAAHDADAVWDMVDDPEGMRLTGTTKVFTRAEITAWCSTWAWPCDPANVAGATAGRRSSCCSPSRSARPRTGSGCTGWPWTS